jgi:putative transposase
VEWHYIAPGKPQKRLRRELHRAVRECLNEHLFASLGQARRIIEAWRSDYNGQRPHTSLNGLTLIEFANRARMNQNRNRLSL